MAKIPQRKKNQLSVAIESAFTAITGHDESHADAVITDMAYIPDGIFTPNDIADLHGIPVAAIGQLFADTSIRMEIKKKRIELTNNGKMVRKSMARTLLNAANTTRALLEGDLNVSSHVSAMNLAYRVSGLEAQDKRTQRKANEGNQHTIIINIGESENRKPIVISGDATGHADIKDGAIIEE